jgi:CubicO group peptidase (beta-lactamase class C family)
MKKNFLLLGLFSSTFCFGQNSSTKSNKLVKPEINTTYIDSFENIVRNDINNKIIAGGAYVLYQKGKVVATNVIGESDNQTHEPLKRNAIFRIASMTKPITSLALLLLQEDGLLNLNDRLDTYLPAFANQYVLDKMDTVNGVINVKTHPAKNPILLRHVITHTAGFASGVYARYKDLSSLYDNTFKDLKNTDLERFANQVAKMPLSFEPGEDWQYGPSINIAARVIEKVSGMSFRDFLNKRIFEPMNMVDTKFFLDSADAPRLTTLYSLDATGKMIMTDPGNESSKLISGPKLFYSGSGGLNSTLDEYLKFCVMVLNNGTYNNKVIAKPETIAFMKTDQIPLNINSGFNPPTTKPIDGFTIGYHIVRKEGAIYPNTINTIAWAGAYGTTFFIDQNNETIGIYLTQNDKLSDIPSWNNFYLCMMKAIKEK